MIPQALDQLKKKLITHITIHYRNYSHHKSSIFITQFMYSNSNLAPSIGQFLCFNFNSAALFLKINISCIDMSPHIKQNAKALYVIIWAVVSGCAVFRYWHTPFYFTHKCPWHNRQKVLHPLPPDIYHLKFALNIIVFLQFYGRNEKKKFKPHSLDLQQDFFAWGIKRGTQWDTILPATNACSSPASAWHMEIKWRIKAPSKEHFNIHAYFWHLHQASVS